MGEPRELLERFGKAITGSESALAEICTSDVEFNDSMSHVHGIAELAPYLKTWSDAFPDASVTIAKLVTSGDQAVGEMQYRGTHTGPMVGLQGTIPPTGKTVDLPGVAWITIRDGKIARFDGYYDTGSMMMQLGLIPAPAGV
jgi:steroid delta-isomerase-like uncharacterized protein